MKTMLKKAYLALCFFALAAIAAGYISWRQCPDMIGFGINIVCISFMALIITAGFLWLGKKRRGLLALCKATDELIDAKSRLQQASSDSEGSLDVLFNGDQNTPALFQLDWLREAFASHRDEANRLYRDTRTFQYIDIADHMNSELLNQIGFFPLNDLIGGAMTGLGILGTFAGLMVGLRDFDPTTAESMMNTIPPLIDGIKVAFLTSIFGVIFSIIFNFVYRSFSQNAEEAMDGFNAEYYRNVLPKPENDGFTQLIQYQEEQSKSMSQLAEQISLTMANALTASVVPTFEKIEKTIDRLSDRLAETQSQNMGKIANEFVRSMNQSMGNQLQHLEENIQKLCLWQDTMVAQMTSHMDSFKAAGDRVETVGVKLEQSISSMDTYVKNMEKSSSVLQASLKSTDSAFSQLLEKLELQQKASGQILETENQVLESMHRTNQLMGDREEQALQATRQLKEEITSISTTVQSNLQASADGILELLSEMQKMMETLQTTTCKTLQESADQAVHLIQDSIKSSSSDTFELVRKEMDSQISLIQANMNSINQTQNAFVEGMNAASKQLAQASKQIASANIDLTANLDKAMSRTYQQFDAQLSDIANHLSGTIIGIKEITEALPRSLKNYSEQTQKITSNYLQTIADSQKQLLNVLHSRKENHNTPNKEN